MDIIKRVSVRDETFGIKYDKSLVPTILKDIIERVWPEFDASTMTENTLHVEIGGVRITYEEFRSRVLMTVPPVRSHIGSPTRRWVNVLLTGQQTGRLDVSLLRDKHLDLIPIAESNAKEREARSRDVDARNDQLNAMYSRACIEPNSNSLIHIREMGRGGSGLFHVTYNSPNNLTPTEATMIASVLKVALDGAGFKSNTGI